MSEHEETLQTNLSQKNAEGMPATLLTDDQKYRFDTHGWLLVPGVLSEPEIEEMRAHCYHYARQGGEGLKPHERTSLGGPLERLIDHPLVVRFMNQFVADPYLVSETGYGFRLESSFLALRSQGADNWGPHGGGGSLAMGHNSHLYRATPGQVYSGLTRAVWELNPVKKGDGGTLLLTGSHKASFPMPASLQERDAPLWEDYDCPAGSVLFFTEALTHSGTRWTNGDVDRVAIFNCYNSIGSKWHDWQPHPDAVEGMPPLRRSLFRAVHCDSNQL